MPYCLYLVLQLICTTGLTSYYFKMIEEIRKAKPDESEALIQKKEQAGMLINIILAMAQILQIFFFSIEMRLFCKGPFDYLSDTSNWLDIGS